MIFQPLGFSAMVVIFYYKKPLGLAMVGLRIPKIPVSHFWFFFFHPNGSHGNVDWFMNRDSLFHGF